MQQLQQFLAKNKTMLIVMAVVIAVLWFSFYAGGATFRGEQYEPGEGGNIAPTFDAENAARNLYTGLDGGTSYTEFTAILEGLLVLTDDELLQLANAYIALYGTEKFPTVTQNINAEDTWMYFWPWQTINANRLRDQVLQRFNNLNIF